MAKQWDGIIEAARYKNGQVVLARAYLRRGAGYTDRELLDRKTLLERLKKGQTFALGARVESMGGTFSLGKPVRLFQRDNQEWMTTKESTDKDDLEGVLFF